MRKLLLVLLLLLATSLSGCTDPSSTNAVDPPVGVYVFDTSDGTCVSISSNQGGAEPQGACNGAYFGSNGDFTGVTEYDASNNQCESDEVTITTSQDTLCRQDEPMSTHTVSGDEVTITDGTETMTMRFDYISGTNVQDLLVMQRTDTPTNSQCMVYVSLDDVSSGTLWEDTGTLFDGYTLPSWCS
ncbi:MAG: hypothetical protein QF885_07185 [Candidatus Thalassarchaeaceae archaeon]|jgi:hypothetical protein|nr:hypothetical protein [Candidatus Thalassarchaeaceae archaeon]